VDIHCRNGFVVVSDAVSSLSQMKGGRPFLLSLQDSYFSVNWLINFTKILPDGHKVFISQTQNLPLILRGIHRLWIRDYMISILIYVIK